MSTYRKIYDAVEKAVFHLQLTTAEEVARFVSRTLMIRNVNPREIDKMIHEVTTQYKKVPTNVQG
jgi:hypothetical protein